MNFLLKVPHARGIPPKYAKVHVHYISSDHLIHLMYSITTHTHTRIHTHTHTYTHTYTHTHTHAHTHTHVHTHTHTQGVYCKYQFYLDQEQLQTLPVSGTSNPNFNYSKHFSINPVTQQFLDYLTDQPLIVEVWGQQVLYHHGCM